MKDDTVNEFLWTLAIVANIVTIFLFFTYLWPSAALNFQRSQALTKDDFTLLTNDYANAKYICVVLLPNLSLPLVIIAFFMRLIVDRFHGDYYSKYQSTKDDDDNVARFKDVLKWIHLGFTIVGLALFTTSLIFLIIDYSDCNTIDSKNDNVCNSMLYCCASDVLTPPGITERCSYILSCNVDPFTTKDLSPDPYFLWIFIMSIIILVVLVIHFLLGYLGEFIISKDEQEEEELLTMNQNKEPLSIKTSYYSSSSSSSSPFGLFSKTLFNTNDTKSE